MSFADSTQEPASSVAGSEQQPGLPPEAEQAAPEYQASELHPESEQGVLRGGGLGRWRHAHAHVKEPTFQGLRAWCVVSNRSRQHAFSIFLMSPAWSARPGRAPGGSRHGRPGGGHLMCFFACPRASLSGQFRAGQLGAIRGACTVTALHASSRAGKRRALLLA